MPLNPKKLLHLQEEDKKKRKSRLRELVRDIFGTGSLEYERIKKLLQETKVD